MKHMHEKRIMHRDLKPANIFLTLDGTVKVGDLGLSRELSEHTVQAHSKVGTPLYMSPEVLRGDGYDFKSDIWSLGCILYELAMLKSPFKAEGLNLYGLFQKINAGDFQPIPENYSEELRSLVYSMMSAKADDRPEISNVCNVATAMREKLSKLRSRASSASAPNDSNAAVEVNGEEKQLPVTGMDFTRVEPSDSKDGNSRANSASTKKTPRTIATPPATHQAAAPAAFPSIAESKLSGNNKDFMAKNAEMDIPRVTSASGNQVREERPTRVLEDEIVRTKDISELPTNPRVTSGGFQRPDSASRSGRNNQAKVQTVEQTSALPTMGNSNVRKEINAQDARSNTRILEEPKIDKGNSNDNNATKQKPKQVESTSKAYSYLKDSASANDRSDTVDIAAPNSNYGNNSSAALKRNSSNENVMPNRVNGIDRVDTQQEKIPLKSVSNESQAMKKSDSKVRVVHGNTVAPSNVKPSGPAVTIAADTLLDDNSISNEGVAVSSKFAPYSAAAELMELLFVKLIILGYPIRGSNMPNSGSGVMNKGNKFSLTRFHFLCDLNILGGRGLLDTTPQFRRFLQVVIWLALDLGQGSIVNKWDIDADSPLLLSKQVLLVAQVNSRVNIYLFNDL